MTRYVQPVLKTCINSSLHVENIWNEIIEDSSSCSFTTHGTNDTARNLCNDFVFNHVVSLKHDSEFDFETSVSALSNVVILTTNASRSSRSPSAILPLFGTQTAEEWVNFTWTSVYNEDVRAASLDRGEITHHAFEAKMAQHWVHRNMHRRTVVNIDVAGEEWSIIDSIVNSRHKPLVLMVRLNMSPSMGCQDFVKAQLWRHKLKLVYELRNWKRTKKPNVVDLVYVLRQGRPPPKCSHCRLKFKAMSEGLGGIVSQVMYGMVLAAERKPPMPFCLANSLVDPEPSHMTDYTWFREYLPIPMCGQCLSSCDVEEAWRHDSWQQRDIVSRFKRLYPQLYEDAVTKLKRSKLTDPSLTHCVHIRSGDLQSIPNVTWSGQQVTVFGGREQEVAQYDFCRRNVCRFVVKQDPEYDLVNLANCPAVVASESTFPAIAHIFSHLRNASTPLTRGGTEGFYT